MDPSSTTHDQAEAERKPRFTLLPDGDGEFTRTGIWLMVGGCCLSLPLALVILALTGSSLPEAQPIFFGIFIAAATGLVLIGTARHLTERNRGRNCC